MNTCESVIQSNHYEKINYKNNRRQIKKKVTGEYSGGIK